MKIIFDSEQQKEKFIDLISLDMCPSDIGVGNYERCVKGNCWECWEESELEMEVKEK